MRRGNGTVAGVGHHPLLCDAARGILYHQHCHWWEWRNLCFRKWRWRDGREWRGGRAALMILSEEGAAGSDRSHRWTGLRLAFGDGGDGQLGAMNNVLGTNTTGGPGGSGGTYGSNGGGAEPMAGWRRGGHDFDGSSGGSGGGGGLGGERGYYQSDETPNNGGYGGFGRRRRRRGNYMGVMAALAEEEAEQVPVNQVSLEVMGALAEEEADATHIILTTARSAGSEASEEAME